MQLAGECNTVSSSQAIGGGQERPHQEAARGCTLRGSREALDLLTSAMSFDDDRPLIKEISCTHSMCPEPCEVQGSGREDTNLQTISMKPILCHAWDQSSTQTS